MFSINRLVKSVFPAVMSTRMPMVNWTSAMGRIRLISQVSVDDENKCSVCKSDVPDEVGLKEIINLPGRQAFCQISDLMGRCRRIGKESFSGKTKEIDCLFTSRVAVVVKAMLSEGVPSVIYYDKESSKLVMDVFLRRRDPNRQEGDLTGDGGLLAFRRLQDRNELDSFANIIDIGGQDSDFASKLISKNKHVFAIIVDINILSWALDKAENVSYAIGAAANILSDQSFLPDVERKRTVFSMNNLINVLLPEEAFETIAATVKRKKSGDRLVITNLDRKQFEGKKDFHEAFEVNGMCVIDRVKLDRGVPLKDRYKTVILNDFVSSILGKFPNLSLVEEPQCAKVECQAPAGVGKVAPVDVQFVTIMFDCIDHEKELT